MNRPFGMGVWHQICSPTNAVLDEHRKMFVPISQWCLKVCAAGVFVNVGKFVLSSRQPLTAHSVQLVMPRRIALNDNFGLLSASGFVGETSGKFSVDNHRHNYRSISDQIYVCQPNSEIFAFSTRTRNLTSLPPLDSQCPSIIALSAAKECLYVLDSCGVVHVRDNLNSHLTPRGKNWLLLSCKDLCNIGPCSLNK